MSDKPFNDLKVGALFSHKDTFTGEINIYRKLPNNPRSNGGRAEFVTVPGRPDLTGKTCVFTRTIKITPN